MLQSLLPIKLSRDDASYQTVEELAEVLRHALGAKDIRNIALTGPFGSGKSSVLNTLMADFKEFNFLPISLATLQANKEGEIVEPEKIKQKKVETEKVQQKDVEPKKMAEEEIETLNRKIEYSILQQIIYKETDKKVPNSRFRRIIHISDDKLWKMSIGAVLFVVAIIIVFFQNTTSAILKNVGINHIHTWIYAILICCIVCGLYKIIQHFVRVYANSKLNKLNLKDGEIEMEDDCSIFNKHLDEILYFFQVTDYKVVIIEDLDRFGTENIFLKLRELNQLINESKIVGRHIVFIYAIKDDVFEDEARTKFFDYISTIIPVINPSNSKDKLKAALKERGFEDGEISDDDLSEIAFFIQDMRILTNIANEYSQYRKKLYETSQKRLSLTKLLAMIVYKNYFPRDFAQLHRREGKVYSCISKKQEFIKDALKVLDNQSNELEETRKLYEKNSHLKENDLRLLFLYDVVDKIPHIVETIVINNKEYKLKQISQDVKLFEQLRSLDSIVYYYRYNSYRYSDSAKLQLDNIAHEMQLDERIELVNNWKEIINKKELALQKEKIKIQSLRLNLLIRNYNLGETKLYKELNLTPLMDVFIRRGYLDEEYYDYISYFYPGMLSQSDRDLLLSIKRQIKQEYTYHIDKIDNFVKELKDYMFEHDAILNIELLDYFAKKKNIKGKESFTAMMMHLEKQNAPLDFLAQYYQLGKQSKEVFTEFITWNKVQSWNKIESHTNQDEQILLQEAWLRYCDEPIEEPIEWLSTNYSFLSTRFNRIGITQCEKLLPHCHFALLDSNSPQLLDIVIKLSCYEINAANLCIILNHINKNSNVSVDNLTLTKITDTNNANLINYTQKHFAETFKCLSLNVKEESKDSIISILNSADVSAEQKIKYLTGQQLIDTLDEVDEQNWIVAIQTNVIAPTWQNVSAYSLKIKDIDDHIISYVEHNHAALEEVCDDNIENKEYLFEQLLGTKKLSIPAFQSICKAFNNIFDEYEALDEMDSEHLKILLYDNKIAFSEVNIGIMQDTIIYSDYLIHFAKDFIANLKYEYNLDIEVALTLMKSNVFTASEKCKISEIIDDKVISESSQLAEIIIDNVLEANYATIAPKKAVVLLKKAQDERLKVNLALLLLSGKKPTDDKIGFFILLLLESLGGIYKEIAERQKHPVLSRSDWNIALLNRLQDLDYISSTSEVKDGIRVYPKRK